MNKLAQYLNQHIVGDVYDDRRHREQYAGDGSPLRITPEFVALPYDTNDIRKIATFCWQLATKGHSLTLAVRGGGTNASGGAIGGGVVLDTSRYMNNVLEYDGKQQLVHLQAGASVGVVRRTLALQGARLPWLEAASDQATAGGVVADSPAVSMDRDVISQLEVVLANGDVLQTGKLSKGEVRKRMGLQGFEGDIYRGIDALLEEYAELLPKLAAKTDGSGYAGIAHIRDSHGSIDLTPLFLGSQGTLGIISELIVKAEASSMEWSFVTAAFSDANAARDVLDGVLKVDAHRVEYFDSSVFDSARHATKPLGFLGEETTRLIVVTLDDVSSRARAKKSKKLRRLFEKAGALVTELTDQSTPVMPEIASALALNEGDLIAPLDIVEGAHIPLDRFDDYVKVLDLLSQRYDQVLGVSGDVTQEMWWVKPRFDMSKVSGKQALVKFIDEYADFVHRLGGSIVHYSGEGRLQSFSVSRLREGVENELYDKIKRLFDPHGILSPGVKQADVGQAIARQLGSVDFGKSAGKETHV